MGSTRLPSALDVYYKDRYFVVPRIYLIALILLAVVVPLAAVTIQRFRAMRRRGAGPDGASLRNSPEIGNLEVIRRKTDNRFAVCLTTRKARNTLSKQV